MEYKGLGLGAMQMNLRAMREGAAVVQAALEENVTLLNTADFYNAGESEVKRIEDAIPENEIAGASFPAMRFKNGVAVG